ncbi:hypothetical protein AUEXF2481DRAFT_85453 [Aureobasidium subglaciale EXF-2481]|uniref:Uncharacterized protein n=1 Tax=Aureobasidium subglaciale (strain EXF-2481) TaxID=1043005 RepID=A0A074YQE1_AURSE|nr:uncharacterized protein AUEXF2481DRAFT_85453 [Aureobasidium subglaciale EXF-2481]KEQ99905.1 hypothetical protein AUEXF2481DRAFT_85453 [Aureobasidium subglaciale EXF-2481]
MERPLPAEISFFVPLYHWKSFRVARNQEQGGQSENPLNSRYDFGLRRSSAVSATGSWRDRAIDIASAENESQDVTMEDASPSSKRKGSETAATPPSSSKKKFLNFMNRGSKEPDNKDSPEKAQEVYDREFAMSMMSSQQPAVTSAHPPLSRSSTHRSGCQGSYIPNHMGDRDEEEDAEVLKTWFPDPDTDRDPVPCLTSFDIHLYPGLRTQLQQSESVIPAGIHGPVLCTRKTLQRVGGPGDPFVEKNIGVWADKRKVNRQIFQPGDVIRAAHSGAQNDLNCEYPARDVRIFQHGAVLSKIRPMVVLYNTFEATICLPMFQNEFMTVTTAANPKGSDWQGSTPGNGKTLTLIVTPGVDMKLESFIYLALPVNLGRSEAVKYKQGHLTKESFVRLMEACTFRENQYKQEAFKELGLRYQANPSELLAANYEHSRKDITTAKLRLTKRVGLTAEEVRDTFKVDC